MYINDLFAKCPGCEFKLFADNLNTYKHMSSVSDFTIKKPSLNSPCCWDQEGEQILYDLIVV